MSQAEKSKKNSGWGGARSDSGPKSGRTKTPLCVTVDMLILLAAKELWGTGKASRLVEGLLQRYIKNPSLVPREEAM
jgi:hypothetical protein